MTTQLQTFKYPGPEGDGGRNRPDGTTSFPMYNSDALISTVQIFPQGDRQRSAHPPGPGRLLAGAGRKGKVPGRG